MTFVKYLDMLKEKTTNKIIIKEIKEGRWMENIYKYLKKTYLEIIIVLKSLLPQNLEFGG